MIQAGLNSDHTVSVNGEGVQVGRFEGEKLVQVWEFAPARSVEFVSPVAWQEGLRHALAARWALVG